MKSEVEGRKGEKTGGRKEVNEVVRGGERYRAQSVFGCPRRIHYVFRLPALEEGALKAVFLARDEGSS